MLGYQAEITAVAGLYRQNIADCLTAAGRTAEKALEDKEEEQGMGLAGSEGGAEWGLQVDCCQSGSCS
jgi:hypothetical protein